MQPQSADTRAAATAGPRRRGMKPRIALAIGATGIALLLPFEHVDAATSGTGTLTVTATAGSLSIASVSSPTISAAVNTTTSASSFGTQTDADATGSGAGWNITAAMQLINLPGTWTQTAGTATSLSTTSAGNYSGAALDDYYDVTVTQAGDTTSATTLTISWSVDGGSATSATATKGTALTLSNGVTITFAASTAYPQNAVYDAHVGAMSTSAFQLNTSSTTCTANSGTSSPVPTAAASNPTITTSASPTTYGTAVKILSAALNQGMGSYTCTPKVNITVGNLWAASYFGGVQYTIATGP